MSEPTAVDVIHAQRPAPKHDPVSLRQWCAAAVLTAAQQGVWDLTEDRELSLLENAEALYEYITEGKTEEESDDRPA